jgi:flagellar motor switch/type III secretory pathway protein FliN
MEAVLAKCQSANEAIGSAFSTAIGGDFQVTPAEPIQINLDDLPASLVGAGLVFGITIDETRCLAVLSQADALLPPWCREPGDESAQKLKKLGLELATAVWPEGTEAKLAGVTFDDDLGQVMRDSQPTGETVCLPLEVVKDGQSAQLSLIWPVASFIDSIAATAAETDSSATPVADAAPKPEAAPEPVAASEPVAAHVAVPPPVPESPSVAAAAASAEKIAASKSKPSLAEKLPTHRRLIYRGLEDGIRQLPAYAQSLLRIKVPVTVTLARTKTTVSKILDIVPGTILQFTKTYDSNLTLEVGQQEVAEGEAVKVGDKFGLWITSITMPEERFWAVNKTAMTKRVK